MPKHKPERADVILAAGGIVWRDSDRERGREYALIHRPRHDDWTLPKGKLDRKERWQEAALREVEEETGFKIELGSFAGSCGYMTRNAPKVVLYWLMHPIGPTVFRPHDSTEVDRLDWLAFDEALARLTYERERRILQDAHAGTIAVDEVEDTRPHARVLLRSLDPSNGIFERLRHRFKSRAR